MAEENGSFQRQLDAILLGAQTRLNMEREHTDEMNEATRALFTQRLDDLARRLDDTDCSNKDYLERVIHDLAERHDDRFGMAVTATTHRISEEDKRYEQRFLSQEQATALALARVDKEFHEHLVSVREETKAALDAADKAIHKSELSIEKRFDAVNEFRSQLADQATSFMPRKESDVRMDALTEKIDSNSDRLNALQLQVTSRLDLTQGASTGGREAVQDKRANNAAVFAAVGFGISLLLALITVVGILLASKP